ncbi:MAG: cytochrome d ubiquinol oxidase subunit II [Myxococcota bacterium]
MSGLDPNLAVAGVLTAVLCAWVLTGGADLGGGLWDLLAAGPRKVAQRRAIALAIAPIWEANHVWLIVAIVITFVAFPRAFAAISIALHWPLTLMLLGVVLRGASFVFRAYAARAEPVQARWSAVFASASAATPILLGVVLGAIASGRIDADGDAIPPGTLPWLAPFPVVVGLLTLAIFAFLAAVYLTLDTREEPALQEDFRRRGLGAAAAVFCLAWAAFFLARTGAPAIWHGLWHSAWAVPLQLAVAACGLSCIGALWTRRYRLARDLGAAQVVLVVGGWAASQYPHVLPPHLTVADAAPAVVVWWLLGVLAVGAVPLAVAYATLMRVFKG